MAEVIDNDFHPIDKGLNATDDHWGTEKVPLPQPDPRGYAPETTYADTKKPVWPRKDGGPIKFRMPER